MPLGSAAVAGIVGAAGVGASASAASKDRAQGKKALEEQRGFNASNRDFLDAKIAEAVVQSEALFRGAASNRVRGATKALDILGQSAPQQLSTFQQGNIGAQEQLLAGLPQIQNALLGLPVDLSGLQPKQVQFDPSFTQQTLPGFKTPSVALQDVGLSGVLPTRGVGSGFFNVPTAGNAPLGDFGSKTVSLDERLQNPNLFGNLV